MEKQKIGDLNLKIAQGYHAIANENAVLDALEILQQRSKDNIKKREGEIHESKISLFNEFFKEFKQHDDFLSFLATRPATPHEKFPSYIEAFEYALITGLPPNGENYRIAKGCLPEKFKVKKFVKAFQQLLNKYLNSSPYRDTPIWTTFSHKVEAGVTTFHLYLDHGI